MGAEWTSFFSSSSFRDLRETTHTQKKTRKELGKLLQRAVILYFFRQPKGPIDQRFATGVSVFSPPPPPSLINRPTLFFFPFFCCCCCSRSFIYCALVLLNRGPVVCLLKRTSTCSLDPDDDLQYGERERESERKRWSCESQTVQCRKSQSFFKNSFSFPFLLAILFCCVSNKAINRQTWSLLCVYDRLYITSLSLSLLLSSVISYTVEHTVRVSNFFPSLSLSPSVSLLLW